MGPTAIHLVCAALAATPACPPQENDALTALLAHHAAEANVGALAVGIEFGGDLVGTWGYGAAASPEARGLPAGGAFELLVAAAALASDANGQLGLDDALVERLPELGALAADRSITHLLQHSGGLPDHAELFGAAAPATALAVVSALADQAPVADPGHCFSWSPSNTVGLGAALERAHEQPLRDVVESLVLGPLERGPQWGDRPRQRGDGWTTLGADTGGTSRADARVIDLWNAADLRADPEDLLGLWSAFRDGDLFGPRLARAAFTVFDEGHGSGGTHALAVHSVRLGELHGWIAGGRLGNSHVSFAWYPEIELAIAAIADAPSADLPAFARSVARSVLDWPEPDGVDLPLDDARAAAYVGGYSIGCTRVEIIAADDRLLLVRAEGAAPLAYQGGHVFAAVDDPDLRLRFEPPQGGLSPGFALDDHGSLVVATRFD